MMIMDATDGEVKPFGELKSGETFEEETGGLFMKFTPTCDAIDADNAVNLKAGYGCRIDEDEEVIIVDAKCIVFRR